MQADFEKCSESSIVNEVVLLRETATRNFLNDFELGKKQKRFISHRLPDETFFKNNSFDLGLSSHFLLMYDYFGIDFHIKSVTEMMRVCREVRIFPTINLHGQESRVLPQLIEYLHRNQYTVELLPVKYKYNNSGRDLLKIKKRQELQSTL